MYWIGLQPGDVHLNISSPGWAKHAWSNVFAPWNAEATALILGLRAVRRGGAAGRDRRARVTTFCAPPTVWRMLIQADLGAADVPLRECVGAGEPLNPEVIEQVRRRVGTHRPRRLRPDRDHRADRQHARASRSSWARWAGRCPATTVALIDPMTGEPADEGEICLDLARAPARADDRLPRRRGARDGRRCAAATTTPATSPPATPTATSPTSGAPTTCSRRRTTASRPFELESVLIEHEAVAEAAVVPSPGSAAAGGAEGVRDAGGRLRAVGETALAILRYRPRRGWPRTSGSAGWSSPSCRRRSPARSAGSSCGRRRTTGTAGGRAVPRPRAAAPSSGRTTSPTSRPDGRRPAPPLPRRGRRCAGEFSW